MVARRQRYALNAIWDSTTTRQNSQVVKTAGQASTQKNLEQQQTESVCSAKKGTYSTTIGSNTDVVCTPCAPGKWSNTDGASSPGDCKECEINYFSADEGRKETCEKCPSDSTTKKKGQTICVKCDAGQYMNTETGDTGASIKSCRAW